VIFYSLYDEKNLYIAVQVKDEDVSSDDNIDLYLFVKNKMHIFSFSPKGEYKGETKVNWVKKIFGTIDNSKDTDNSYWIVFSIPLNLLKITPQEKEIIKINVVNIDNKSGFKSWSNLINSQNFLKNPELFVDFIFED
jgi:mannose/fructose/N-acetylgalactosamine-specific phosphotransferase system component IIB